jgi:hypothetical protein
MAARIPGVGRVTVSERRSIGEEDAVIAVIGSGLGIPGAVGRNAGAIRAVSKDKLDAAGAKRFPGLHDRAIRRRPKRRRVPTAGSQGHLTVLRL